MQKDDKNILVENWLDEALKTSPEFSLSENFADKVAAKVSRRFAWEDYIKEFLVYLGIIVGVAAVSVAMAFIWLGADWQEWQNFLANNLAWIAGLNVLGLFILFADRVLLRYFFYRFSGQNLN
ncbi:hypothetical protein [Mariniphaga sp.]|uniref:hypothetical protein n=1 Tax=Mariniphaga sp. TaxID=1954475 RepID=UPI0035621D5D